MDETVDAWLTKSADNLAIYGDDALMLAEHLATRLPEPEMRAFWRRVQALLDDRERRKPG